jgi:acyl carrier protein
VNQPAETGAASAVDDLAEQIRMYFGSMTGIELRAEDDIFELGLVNSLRALEIVAHVEHTYALTVDVEDLDLDNFRTAARLAGFVAKKRETANR